MNSEKKILTAIREIADDFNGEIVLKDSRRKYFFVNDNWLEMIGLEGSNVTGKIDAEVLPPPVSMQIMMEDKKAIEGKLPPEYIGKINLNGINIIRVVAKWAVYHDSGDLFCICMLSVRPENKRSIYEVRKKVEALFEKVA